MLEIATPGFSVVNQENLRHTKYAFSKVSVLLYRPVKQTMFTNIS